MKQKGRPLAYFSRTLTDTEKRYSTFDREFLAIYLSVKHFKYMLDGSPIIIETDHKPLISVMNITEPSNQQWRWINFLQQFNIVFRHIRGEDNVMADFLSRQQEHEIIGAASIPAAITLDELVRLQAADNDIQEFKEDQRHSLQIVSRNRLFFDVSTGKSRLLLPGQLRKQEIARLHNLSHPGRKPSIKLVTDRYIWPNMKRDVADFVRNCQACQRNKISKHTKSPLGELPTAEHERFSVLHRDIAGPLPSCEGYKYLLTVIDRETNWFEAITVRNISSHNVTKALVENWISKFGVPEIIITDQGTQFQSDYFKDIARILGIEQRRTTAYHPQCNGKIERVHRTLKTALRAHMNSQGGTWKQNLPWVFARYKKYYTWRNWKSKPKDFGDKCCTPRRPF